MSPAAARARPLTARLPWLFGCLLLSACCHTLSQPQTTAFSNSLKFSHSARTTACSVPLSDWDLPAAAAGDADGEGDPTPEVDANAAGGRSNAALLDDGSAQVLSMEDIEAMKAEGRAGADIVTALTTNSATFANKTEFSQAKYKCVGGWSGCVRGGWVGGRAGGLLGGRVGG